MIRLKPRMLMGPSMEVTAQEREVNPSGTFTSNRTSMPTVCTALLKDAA